MVNLFKHIVISCGSYYRLNTQNHKFIVSPLSHKQQHTTGLIHRNIESILISSEPQAAALLPSHYSENTSPKYIASTTSSTAYYHTYSIRRNTLQNISPSSYAAAYYRSIPQKRKSITSRLHHKQMHTTDPMCRIYPINLN